MADAVFLFVDVDDPTTRGSKAHKPASQRYTKEARKHVMRDIGLSRRKEKPEKAPKSRGASHQLDSVDGATFSPRGVQKGVDGDQEPSVMLQTRGSCIDEIRLPPDLEVDKDRLDYLALEPARIVGAYRQDPFVKYPMELNYRARQLLDTRGLEHPKEPHKVFGALSKRCG